MVQERLSVWLCYKQKQVSATVCLGLDNSGYKILRNTPRLESWPWIQEMDRESPRGGGWGGKNRLLGKSDLILWIGFRVNFKEELAMY